MPSSNENQRERERIRRLLLAIPVIQNACSLDLLVFLYRHPRTLLTNEQLAGFVGYGMKDVAKALDRFSDAGLLERATQRSNHAARMYSLLLEGPQGEGLRLLLQEARTRQGRQSILEALDSGSPHPVQTAEIQLRLVKRA
jgi:DNA-binding MarR family transcriptional regulator